MIGKQTVVMANEMQYCAAYYSTVTLQESEQLRPETRLLILYWVELY